MKQSASRWATLGLAGFVVLGLLLVGATMAFAQQPPLSPSGDQPGQPAPQQPRPGVAPPLLDVAALNLPLLEQVAADPALLGQLLPPQPQVQLRLVQDAVQEVRRSTFLERNAELAQAIVANHPALLRALQANNLSLQQVVALDVVSQPGTIFLAPTPLAAAQPAPGQPGPAVAAPGAAQTPEPFVPFGAPTPAAVAKPQAQPAQPFVPFGEQAPAVVTTPRAQPQTPLAPFGEQPPAGAAPKPQAQPAQPKPEAQPKPQQPLAPFGVQATPGPAAAPTLPPFAPFGEQPQPKPQAQPPAPAAPTLQPFAPFGEQAPAGAAPKPQAQPEQPFAPFGEQAPAGAAAKPEPKPEAQPKPEPKPQAKPEAQPKPEAKPQPKPEQPGLPREGEPAGRPPERPPAPQQAVPLPSDLLPPQFMPSGNDTLAATAVYNYIWSQYLTREVFLSQGADLNWSGPFFVAIWAAYLIAFFFFLTWASNRVHRRSGELYKLHIFGGGFLSERNGMIALFSWLLWGSFLLFSLYFIVNHILFGQVY